MPTSSDPVRSPIETLEGADAGTVVLQSYRPIGQSLDWELGQLYYLEHGLGAFSSGDVPYVINNDGTLSGKAAELLFAAQCERESAESQPAELRVLELGIGSGLFARGFLDAFADLCREGKRDFYRRLTYIMADRSARMLEDLHRHGILGPHRERVRTLLTDATDLDLSAAGDPLIGGARCLDAVFLNYILDCLPSTLLRQRDGRTEQLCLQIEVSRQVADAPGATHSIEELVRLAQGAEAERRRLAGSYHLFTLRCEYRPVEEDPPPFLGLAREQLHQQPSVLLNYGAVRCLDACLERLNPGGFALISDYPYQPPAEGDEPTLYQHFGASTAIGLHWSVLQAHVTAKAGCTWDEPDGAERLLPVHLIGCHATPATRRRFADLFAEQAVRRLLAPVERARRLREASRPRAALLAYCDALRLQPRNWSLVGEIAWHCERTLGDSETALGLARAGLAINPLDPGLWNTLGDSLYSLGRLDEAHDAFRSALDLEPRDIRTRYNLVYTLARKHAFDEALRAIADALAIDTDGDYRERLLERQGEVLQAIAQRHRERQERLADRYLIPRG